jgi:hypothetical protein
MSNENLAKTVPEHNITLPFRASPSHIVRCPGIPGRHDSLTQSGSRVTYHNSPENPPAPARGNLR